VHKISLRVYFSSSLLILSLLQRYLWQRNNISFCYGTFIL
jgi:hypothetical protein